jgi:hypothetical protein
VLGLVGPIRVDLSHILLNHNVVILFAYVPALVVMVHSLLSVAFDNILPKDSYRLVRHLSFPRALLGGLKELDWVVCPSILQHSIDRSFIVGVSSVRRCTCVGASKSADTQTKRMPRKPKHNNKKYVRYVCSQHSALIDTDPLHHVTIPALLFQNNTTNGSSTGSSFSPHPTTYLLSPLLVRISSELRLANAGLSVHICHDF